MSDALYFPKWGEVLIEVYKARDYNRYCQKLNKQVKMSINHLRATIRQLEYAKLIEIKPSRKIKRISLTQQGETIALSFIKIKSELLIAK